MANKDEFINRAKIVHGDLYDYSKVSLNRYRDSIEIVCSKHGSFFQLSYVHLRGSGCPVCARERIVQKLTRTLSEFISEAKSIHGDRYDYSRTKYVNDATKIEIICPVHYSFLQTPAHHLRGSGCRKCAVSESILPFEQWLKRARNVHGDKYDYDASTYVAYCGPKIKITCKNHGDFWMAPVSHTHEDAMQGCPKCGDESRIKKQTHPFEQWVEEAKLVHGDRYDYSKSVYTKKFDKIEIICKVHGSFWMRPMSHSWQKQGCPKCGIISSMVSGRDTKEEFIEKSKQLHGDKYDYIKVNYINSLTPVEIICKDHGIFWQTPISHSWAGHGCNKCAGRLVTDIQSFIEESKKVHGNKYDYSKSIYIGGNCQLEIICKKHGLFSQRAADHTGGSGCPKCKSSHGETMIRRFFEKENINFESQKKFDDCVNPASGRKLSYDFYVPSKNLLIEYDGILHFPESVNGKVGNHTVTIDDINRTKVRDNIKTNYAKFKDIPLLRIHYKQIGELKDILSWAMEYLDDA